MGLYAPLSDALDVIALWSGRLLIVGLVVIVLLPLVCRRVAHWCEHDQ
jgi:hypothetical protein